MNTLARNFDYIATPWVNLDLETGVHFYSPHVYHQMFQQMDDKPVLNIFKSHHHYDFVADFIEYLTGQFHVFYIYRDPRDVMVSFWRILQTYDWDRGPKAPTVGEFMRSEPMGDILRYQKRQMSSVLHRWTSHVQGWRGCENTLGAEKIFLINYGDLDRQFDTTVKNIGKRIGSTVVSSIRPDKTDNVISPGPGGRTHSSVFTPADYDYVMQVAGETMEQLGIPWEAD
ncbi:MAG: hypothetical protein BMS9Abin06_1159 [Gammaproteobacteria bacterium]|nr:MAG: hypothetical protein BMS9Abin06_1159 [Gammaproteobacteria bacterium]